MERTDGDFKGGHKSLWTIQVKTASESDPVRLRPVFFGAAELCAWVDRVFPGSAFGLLPPTVVTEVSPQPADPSAADTARYAFGNRATDAIRVIGDGLAGGNAYEPDQGYRPPPGAPPRAI